MVARVGGEGEGLVHIPPVEMFLQEATSKQKTKYYPSQSTNSLLKVYLELNPTTHLDPGHVTTSFSADQMIHFARTVGLEVSLASFSMLEDLLLKARGGSGAYQVTSRYAVGISPFPSVAGSSMGDSVASWSTCWLPTIAETEGTNVIVGGAAVEEPCSNRQADARLTMGIEGSKRLGNDSLKTLQQIRSSRKKKSRSWKWSREG